MIGRGHRGDENGDTTFTCGRIYIDNVQVTVVKLDIWGTVTDENRHEYQTPANQVITGIRHDGDENGWTQYEYGWISYTG
ncbi:hypothetical protein DMB42_13090 [Nonomuraea sp. WAC 01424]|uniref:hypothetical protein n=1 Tax=Nonomuraea sp. WAC 01424 TaxID=2203200 RepID=UPI000F7677EE|nr:hypothetical protein [Nonomuraea sp. WAC 01424]RSN11519.1 hypothetical protein DMB42_13090 [Nonomuraea sp. WAC 01424]